MTAVFWGPLTKFLHEVLAELVFAFPLSYFIINTLVNDIVQLLKLIWQKLIRFNKDIKSERKFRRQPGS